MAATNTLLLKTLALLSKREQKRLLLFAESPLHNTRQDVRRLLQKLTEQPPTTEKAVQQAISYALDTDNYTPKQASYVQSYAFSVLQDFQAWESFNERSHMEAFHLRRMLIPGGEDSFKHQYLTAMDQLANQPLRDADYHLQRSRLLDLQYQLGLLHNRNQTNDLTESSRETTIFFIIERLRHGCSYLMQQRIHGKSQRPDLLDEVIALAATPAYNEVPAIFLYYHAYHALLNTDDDEHFNNLLQAISQSKKTFPAYEARDIILMAVNGAIQRVNTGRQEHLAHIMQLYEIGLAQDAFIEGGYLSRFTYNNIIVAAMRLKRFDWAEHFARQYAERIDPTYRESARVYNLAFIAYQDGRHHQALDWLQQMNKDDKLHQLDTRRMLLRIYYELKEWDALDSLLDSFKLYIYRQKDLGYHRSHYLNLIKFVGMLIRIRPGNTTALTKLKTDIETCKSLAERGWLLEKVGQI
jgi:tetratricopeptide (TPR) repeat protein